LTGSDRLQNIEPLNCRVITCCPTQATGRAECSPLRKCARRHAKCSCSQASSRPGGPARRAVSKEPFDSLDHTLCLLSQTSTRWLRDYVEGVSTEGVHMKNRVVLFILPALFLLFGTVDAWAQEKSYITVKGSEQNNGVVMMDVLRESKAYRLTCNQGMPGCATLKNGRYQMLSFPRISECTSARMLNFMPSPLSIHQRTGELANFAWKKSDAEGRLQDECR